MKQSISEKHRLSKKPPTSEPPPFWRRHCPPLHLALHLAPAGQLHEQAQLLLAFYGYVDGVESRTRYKHVKGNKKKSDGGKKKSGSG